jgi:ribosomal protein L19E
MTSSVIRNVVLRPPVSPTRQKDQRPDRPNGNTHGECEQRAEESDVWIARRIELRRENRRQARENEEIVKLDHRPD